MDSRTLAVSFLIISLTAATTAAQEYLRQERLALRMDGSVSGNI